MAKMTTEDALLLLRKDPRHADLVRDCYIEADFLTAAKRFGASAEFTEVLTLLGEHLNRTRVLDLGAGTGIASYALAQNGALLVYAVEPNPSSEFGAGAIRRLTDGLPIEVLEACGEHIPLEDNQVDVIYTREVLHHASDLKRLVRECARVLKPGGVFLACREPVVDDADQLRRFLNSNPVHQMAGGENAYPLETYLVVIREAGLVIERVLEPWDSVINAFPQARTNEDMAQFPLRRFRKHYGPVWRLLRLVPGLQQRCWREFCSRRVPGRMYTFLTVKPGIR
jgi:SAM-dependent methyltransferase